MQLGALCAGLNKLVVSVDNPLIDNITHVVKLPLKDLNNLSTVLRTSTSCIGLLQVDRCVLLL